MRAFSMHAELETCQSLPWTSVAQTDLLDVGASDCSGHDEVT